MADYPFSRLDPDTVLACVEQALGRRLLNVCRPHTSYINRVFELQDEDGVFIIAKFYRPHRWSEAALQDEVRFLLDCAAHELPVIAPLPFGDGKYLGSCGDIRFAVYPRCGGRLVDEYQDEHWLQIGRLLGRLHQVGRSRTANARERLHPRYSTRKQADYLLGNRLLPEDLVAPFRRVVDALIEEMAPRFDGVESLRIHGDCHAANLIYRPGESFYIIDFDDMVVGPAIQDLWMLLPGPLDQVQRELSLLLEGYESFSPFAEQTIQLIESLRAMRFVHYLSWCGRQYLEDGQTRIDESYASYGYWQREIADLQDQLEIICGRR